jgi:hypothetical protein
MLCPGGCGQYVDEAHNPENAGGYEAHQQVCYACAAREELQRSQTGDSRAEPGSLTYVRKLQKAPRRRRGPSRPV